MANQFPYTAAKLQAKVNQAKASYAAAVQRWAIASQDGRVYTAEHILQAAVLPARAEYYRLYECLELSQHGGI